jgi:hypothetical protein
LVKGADISSRQDRENSEQAAVIACEGIGSEKVTAAANDLWSTVQFFDVARDNNEGFAMQAALIALGQVEGTQFLPQVVLRLNNFNTQTFSDVETRRRVNRAVIGCVKALESFKHIDGFRPVFFVSVGSYEKSIQEVASNTLPNIVDDPGEVVSALIRDPSNNPRVKLEAWREMLKTKAPGTSKAAVAAVALATGWNYTTQDLNFQTNLREMRKSALQTIGQFGISDDSVYANLERSYTSNFINNTPDFEEIRYTLQALAASKSDQSVALLEKFLRELHDRRQSGPWARQERQCLEWVVFNLGATGTKSSSVKFLLQTMSINSKYTGAEKKMINSAWANLG